MGLVGTVPVAVYFCGVRPFRRIVLGFGFAVFLGRRRSVPVGFGAGRRCRTFAQETEGDPAEYRRSRCDRVE